LVPLHLPEKPKSAARQPEHPSDKTPRLQEVLFPEGSNIPDLDHQNGFRLFMNQTCASASEFWLYGLGTDTGNPTYTLGLSHLRASYIDKELKAYKKDNKCQYVILGFVALGADRGKSWFRGNTRDCRVDIYDDKDIKRYETR
jgi:hypothetical protein